MKRIMTLFFSVLALTLSAAEDSIPVEKLLAGRAKLEKEMVELRMKYIRRDESAKKLYEQIVKLNRELTLLLNTQKEIQDLNTKIIDLDVQIKQNQTKTKTQTKNGGK